MSRISVIICLLAVTQLSSPSAARRSCNHGGKRCDRLMRFLQSVLDSRDDLTWIDQKAAEMRSKDSYSDPPLQDKINAMFLIKTEDKDQIRPKRQSNNSESLKQKFKASKKKSTMTNEDSLEKLLRSINVFPVENETISYDNETNHFSIGRSLKSISLDNYRTRTNMNRAIFGDLAKEIVDEVLNHVKNKERNLGSVSEALIHRPLQSFVAESFYENEQNFEKGKDSMSITQKLLELCRELIAEEVEKRSCVTLPTDLRRFLVFLLYPGKSDPMAKVQVKKSAEYNTSMDHWYRINEILNDLLDEYDVLTKKEKKKVQAIYEYLASRHSFVKSSIEAFESRKMPVPV